MGRWVDQRVLAYGGDGRGGVMLAKTVKRRWRGLGKRVKSAKSDSGRQPMKKVGGESRRGGEAGWGDDSRFKDFRSWGTTGTSEGNFATVKGEGADLGDSKVGKKKNPLQRGQQEGDAPSEITGPCAGARKAIRSHYGVGIFHRKRAD